MGVDRGRILQGLEHHARRQVARDEVNIVRVKVTAIIVLETSGVEEIHNRIALEKLAWNKGDNLDRAWAWSEAVKHVNSSGIKVELL